MGTGPPGGRSLVLASASRHRARLLAAAGVPVVVDAPDIDERAADDLLRTAGPEALAVELARRKAAAVAPRHAGCWVLGADQVGLVGHGASAELLTKQPTVTGAVDQLMAMAGTTHRLVNGVVLLDVDSGLSVHGVDVQVVTMRSFDRTEAHDYVDRFAPHDSAGSYRLEDQDAMRDGRGFVVAVQGEDDSGVVGLPMPLVRRLFNRLAAGLGK